MDTPFPILIGISLLLGFVFWFLNRALSDSTSSRRSRKSAADKRWNNVGSQNKHARRSRQLRFDDLAQRLKVSNTDLRSFRPGYRVHSIPKKQGGMRQLQIPDEATKRIQRRILHLLLRKLSAHPQAHGFERKRSTATHAAQHTNAAAIVKLDIEDFFPSTHAKRIERFFARLGWDRECVKFLVAATTHRKGLPQGAPTSPRLSNLVNSSIDRRMAALAEAVGATYSRYADDITFSFHHNFQSTKARFRHFTLWQRIRCVIGTTETILASRGYSLNDAKQSIRRANARQCVTGIVVNQHRQLPRERRRWIRAVMHRLSQGERATISAQQLQGWLAYEQMVTGHQRPPEEWQQLKQWIANEQVEQAAQPANSNATVDRPPTADVDSQVDIESQIRTLANLSTFAPQFQSARDQLIGQRIDGKFVVERRYKRITQPHDQTLADGFSVLVRDQQLNLEVELLLSADLASLANQLAPGQVIRVSCLIVEWDSTFARPKVVPEAEIELGVKS